MGKAIDAEAVEVIALLGDSVLDVQYLHVPRRAYVVGSSPRADFALATTTDNDDVPLVIPAGSRGYVVGVPAGWDCEDLPSGPAGLRRRISNGRIAFLVSETQAPRRQGAALLAAIEMRYLAYLAKTTLVTLVLMLLLATHFEEEMTLYGDAFGSSQRLSLVASTPAESQLLHRRPMGGLGAGMTGGTGARAAGNEGHMGKQTALPRTRRYAIKKVQSRPQLSREAEIQRALESGVLNVLGSRTAGYFTTPVGGAEFSSGLDDVDAYGGLIGNTVGEAQGAWGYSLVATGPGGGGTGWGTIGAGDYGTLGHGTGTGWGYGAGIGHGGIRERSSQVPGVAIGAASAIGDLDRNIIRRYIRRKLPQIRHCYEKQLLATPELSGTVDVHFLISPQGLVSNAKATGLGHDDVETCVADSIRSIRFPEPPGAGFVQVHYPFSFFRAGD